MRKLVIGDLHFNDNFLVFKRVLFPYIERVISEYKVDGVILVGDIFECSSLSNTVLSLFKQLMTIFSDHNVEVLVGNHDKIDTKTSAFDVLLLSQNIKIFREPTYSGNEIFIPHINTKVEFTEVFTQVNRYIDKHKYDKYFIYSHNDFSDVYTFNNKFFDLQESFCNLKHDVYLINGHNHVPVFKAKGKLNILNIGCAINLNYRDSGSKNVFLVIDYKENEPDKIFTPLLNKYSVQYHTIPIETDDDVYDRLSELNKDNIKYIKFKVVSPNVVIDSDLRDSLMKNFNIAEIEIDYELKLETYNEDNLGVEDAITETSSVIDLLATLDITYEEFFENNSVEDYEKAEILFSLIGLMFDETDIPDKNREGIKSTLKKYYLNT